jgi:hypothetical protein
LRRCRDPSTNKPAVHSHRLGRFDPRLARSYHRHRDTAQLRLCRWGQLAKIPFNCHTGHIVGQPRNATYLPFGLVIGGSESGIYWEVGSSATLGTTTTFAGNILAHESITLNTNAAILCGRAIAKEGAVTLDSNTISNDCTTLGNGRTDFGSGGFSGPHDVTPVPEPASLVLLVSSLLGGLGLIGRRRKEPAQAR